jgi:hypothetical protein
MNDVWLLQVLVLGGDLSDVPVTRRLPVKKAAVLQPKYNHFSNGHGFWVCHGHGTTILAHTCLSRILR